MRTALSCDDTPTSFTGADAADTIMLPASAIAAAAAKRRDGTRILCAIITSALSVGRVWLTAAVGGADAFGNFTLLDERQRVMHVLREHHAVLGDGLDRSVGEAIAAADDVGLVVRRLDHRQVAGGAADYALHGDLVHQQSGHAAGALDVLRLPAAPDQADERITPALGVVGVAGGRRRLFGGRGRLGGGRRGSRRLGGGDARS